MTSGGKAPAPWIVARRVLAQRLYCSVPEIERLRSDDPDLIFRELKVMKIEATYRATPSLD